MTINIQFDYRFDSAGFYDAEKRATLQEAARIWGEILQDDFDEVPAGISFTIDNPSAGGTRETIVLDAPIDDLLIFMGTETLGGPLAIGGFDGTSAVGDSLRTRVAQDFRGDGPDHRFRALGRHRHLRPRLFLELRAGCAGSRRERLSDHGHPRNRPCAGVGTAWVWDTFVSPSGFTGSIPGRPTAAIRSRWSRTAAISATGSAAAAW
ncbi:hypothetical protein [Jannaschia sp. M317]|uniref:hypothetical protein n=1 Tax=Jannaschia sp. M317 TaxID=2867011 RepID=UPI0021A55458|nr:hypothetical protein [Jannaschia sp. M317]UWQ19656.1 hypothetical protein K3551_18035 [Jannaschia sp. M317]